MTASPFKPILLDLLQQGHLDEEAFLQELPETERAAIGTPQLWSAKDHIVHRTFWHQDLASKLTAILQHQEVAPNDEDDDRINARVFEEHKLDSFSTVHAEAERVYAQLMTLLEQLSEEDLMDSHRFAPISGERPLYGSFLGGCYEHDQEHLAQYYSDRNYREQAIAVRERCVKRIVDVELPAWVKGWFLYNLACFYAQLPELPRAAALLQEALIQAPDLKEHSLRDPDLAPLRDQSA